MDKYQVVQHGDAPNRHLYQVVKRSHGTCYSCGIVAIGRTHEQAISEAARLNAEERKRDAAEQMLGLPKAVWASLSRLNRRISLVFVSKARTKRARSALAPPPFSATGPQGAGHFAHYPGACRVTTLAPSHAGRICGGQNDCREANVATRVGSIPARRFPLLVRLERQCRRYVRTGFVGPVDGERRSRRQVNIRENCGDSSTGRASAFQADGCGFDSRSPLCEPVAGHVLTLASERRWSANVRVDVMTTSIRQASRRQVPHGFAQLPSRASFRITKREIGVAARQPSTTSGRRPNTQPTCGYPNRASRPASPSLSFLSGGASSSVGFTATSRSLDDSIGNGIVTRGSTANAVPSLKAGRCGCVFSSQQRSERSQHLRPARRHDIRARATF